jgi:hypothetical protein
MFLEDIVDENIIDRFENEKIEMKAACRPRNSHVRCNIPRMGQNIVQYEVPVREKTVVAWEIAILLLWKCQCDTIKQPYCSIAANAIQCAVSLSTLHCRTVPANGSLSGINNIGCFEARRIYKKTGTRRYKLPPIFTIGGLVD